MKENKKSWEREKGFPLIKKIKPVKLTFMNLLTGKKKRLPKAND